MEAARSGRKRTLGRTDSAFHILDSLASAKGLEKEEKVAEPASLASIREGGEETEGGEGGVPVIAVDGVKHEELDVADDLGLESKETTVAVLSELAGLLGHGKRQAEAETAALIEHMDEFLSLQTSDASLALRKSRQRRLSAREGAMKATQEATAAIAQLAGTTEEKEEEGEEEKAERLASEEKQNHKAEQVFLRKFAADISKSDFDFLRCTPQWLYRSLPETRVCTQPEHKVVMDFEGPDDYEREDGFGELVCARSVSSYPRLPNHPKREGDPICDSYKYRLFHSNRVVAVVADGCNWGPAPRTASRSAGRRFCEYVTEHQDDIRTVRDAGHVLLRATSHAHNSILLNKEKLREAGTTTLLGGILLQTKETVAGSQETGKKKWTFVCVNVGDCKAFLFRESTQEVREVNVGSRSDAADATDPGGRLGPFLEGDAPDLRNLELFSCECEEGDILALCSDGVFDNLDPKPQGLTPRDFGLEQEEWTASGLNYHFTEELFAMYRIEFLKELVFRSNRRDRTSVKHLTDLLIQHALQNTEQSRSWMKTFPGKRLPKDWIQFPGKMDHTTCLAFRVGTKEQACSSFEQIRQDPRVMYQLREFASTKGWVPDTLFHGDRQTHGSLLRPLIELHIPLSITVFETDKNITLKCYTLKDSSLTCVAEEHRVFVSVVPFQEWSLPIDEPTALFGLDELSQPIFRTVVLPKKVLPSTKTMSYDRDSGLVTISFSLKPPEHSLFSVVSVL